MPSSGRGKNSASLDWFLPKAAPFGAAFEIRFDSHDTKKEMHPERVHLFFGGAGVPKDEHPSEAPVSPSNAVSISSSGILSMLNGFLLALMMRVK